MRRLSAPLGRARFPTRFGLPAFIGSALSLLSIVAAGIVAVPFLGAALGAGSIGRDLRAQEPASVAESATAVPIGTLIIAHGAGEGWNARVHDIAAIADPGGPVEVSFLMGDEAEARPFQTAARRLVEAGAERIVVVPLFVSSHSGHYEQIRYLAGETDSLSDGMLEHLHHSGIHRPELDEVQMHVVPALDDARELATVLADRTAALATEPEEQALFLVGHGPNSPEDYAAWMENLRAVAGELQERAGFRFVSVGVLRDDAAPPVRAEAVRRMREIIELQHAATEREVVVVPILMSSGGINRRELPEDLAGLPVVYGGEPLLPHPAIAEWIERRVREATAASGRVSLEG